jgi:hypothetical protein
VLDDVTPHVRHEEVLDPGDLVVRGWPLTVEGLLRNAYATRARFVWRGLPFVAISTEVAAGRWSLDRILAGPRLRTRSRYAVTTVAELQAAGFELLPTFGPPHCSVVLGSYDVRDVQRLLEVLGETRSNPYFVRRQP